MSAHGRGVAGRARGSAGRPAGLARRSSAASARSSPARRAPRSTATAPKTMSTRRSSKARRRRRISARARGGLGIVPGRTQHHGYLWRRPIASEPARAAARPGAPALSPRDRARSSTAIVDRFGCALLLDCHSMPPPPPGVAPIVFGDCHGRSAARWVSAEALRLAPRRGLLRPASTTRSPAAISSSGTARRGAASTRLQIEIDRRCYLDDKLDGPGPGSTASPACSKRSPSGSASCC